MKKIYIIHGWYENSSEKWIDWLKTELERKGIDVYALDMPDSKNPKIENWVKFLEKKIPFDEIDDKTYFVGHSIGCQTIMRFLEKLPKHLEIGGCVFVAGWFNLINLEKKEIEIAHPWINTKIDFNRIRRHFNNSLAIFSDNDPYVPVEESDKFKEYLGSKILIKHKQGHFTYEEDGITKIPEALKFLSK